LVKGGIEAKALRISDLPNPLLHLMRELRNLEIHLTSSQLSKAKKDVTVILFDTEHQSQTTIWTVSDLTVEKFQELGYTKKRYSEEEIREMVTWFNEAQHDWGVNDLLLRAIVEWASAIIKTYCLAGV
jgi:hypothetical protein